MTAEKIAVVTGANRGIGFETCRQLARRGFEVLLTSRDRERGEAAAMMLRAEELRVSSFVLDVTSLESARRLAAHVEKEYGRLDVLVNNAGVFLDPHRGSSLFEAQESTIRETFETNALGAFRVIQTLVPLMRKSGSGRVINVSSGMGQLSEMNGGYPGYRLSKVALNALTRILADEVKGTDILVNSMCPGWVRTEMGGPDATRSIEEGTDTIVYLATLPAGGPSGKFFMQRQEVAW